MIATVTLAGCGGDAVPVAGMGRVVSVLDGDTVVQALLAGLRASPLPLHTHSGLIVCALRHLPPAETLRAAELALRWVMDQPFMTSAIVGARNVEQLTETLKAGGWRLPGDALAKLNEISAQSHRYPRAFEDPMPQRRASALKMPGDTG